MATVLCDCGTAWLTQLMNATISATTYCLGWGVGAGTAAKADTAISSEWTPARVATANSISAFNQMQWIATLSAANSCAITNAGLFHNNSGTLLIHGDFTSVPLNANDRIQFTVTLTST